jgi:broad specificity phosphatase PhoE
MATILWARHGENVANLTRTFSYRVFDGDLTDLGRLQAAQLAERLAAGEPISQIVCSPLRRARQTAEIVARRLRLPIRAELDDLRELNVGALDGRSDEQAWGIYDSVLAAWKDGQTAVRFPGGEDCQELRVRIRRALAAVTSASGAADGGLSLVVAHGGALRAALSALTGVPEPGTDIPTGGFAVLRVRTDADGLPPGAGGQDAGVARQEVEVVSWPAPATGQ